MSTNGGHRTGPGSAASVTGAVPVVLVRYRPGGAGESARTVHLVPLPDGGQPGAVSALCGRLLRPEEIEQVTPGVGMPCAACAVSHVISTPAPDTEPAAPGPAEELSPDAGPSPAGLAYRAWGWAVAVRWDQVWLRLDAEAVALIMPIPLAVRVAAILIQRRCPSAVLVHPYAPDDHVLLAGERYPIVLPLPAGVHRVTGALLLPPTTPRGPLTWIHPLGPHALRLCREMDVIAALRSALDDPPPTAPTAF